MRVLVVADRPVIQDYLKTTVQSTLLLAQITAVADIEAGRTVASTWRPDMAVVDLGVGERELRRFCAELSAQGVRAVVAAGGADEALRLLQAGAMGITSSAEGVAGLSRTLRAVAHGDAHVPSALLASVLEGLIGRAHLGTPAAAADAALKRLSAREHEVLELLGEGLDQAAIARRLAISPETAKTHIRHLLNKLGVRSRVEAAALAAELRSLAGGHE